MNVIPIHPDKPSVRKKNRSLTQRFAVFLGKTGLLKSMRKIGMVHKRRKKDSATSYLLEFLFSKLWRTGSAYASSINIVPKNIQRKFGVKRFAPKSTFYDEIPSINLPSLETFNDKLVQKAVKNLKQIIVMLDGHAMEMWSENYCNAKYGATSSEHKFFGYKLLATIINGLDVVAKHLLISGNHSATPFAKSLVEQTLQILPRIDVLLMDREFTDFTFWTWLILQNIGFIIPAKDDNAVTKAMRRTIDSKVYKHQDENTDYYESIAFFPDLKKNLRVIFIKKKFQEKIREYELITNLPAQYSTIEVIKLYPVRQGREDVFDRLKNEFALHKPCKIKDYTGIEAFVALTITTYNLYTSFSHNSTGTYLTLVVMFRWWLFGQLDTIIEVRQQELNIENAMPNPPNNNTRQPSDCQTS